MSLSIKFSLVLHIFSGFYQHVRPSQNKTFIFNSINLFYFHYSSFKVINKLPNRHLFCYLFLIFTLDIARKYVLDVQYLCTSIMYVHHKHI